jgi:hypothetical protein
VIPIKKPNPIGVGLFLEKEKALLIRVEFPICSSDYPFQIHFRKAM